MDRILLAFDGSPAAWHALDEAAALAHLSGAEIGVVHVVQAGPGAAPEPTTPALIEARDALRARRLEPSLFAVGGDPAEAIERLASEGGFDMVVVGARPLGPLKRLIRGSVAERVAAASPVTVVVARPD